MFCDPGKQIHQSLKQLNKLNCAAVSTELKVLQIQRVVVHVNMVSKSISPDKYTCNTHTHKSDEQIAIFLPIK